MASSVAVIDAAGRSTGDDEHILPVYSIAKTFIASLVVEAGIDLDTPISDWIDFSWVPRAEDISILQLLNHTSGLRDYGALPLYAKAIAEGTPPWTDEEFAEQTLKLPLLFEPGTRFAYSNPGYWLLTQIIEQERGLPFDALVDALCASLNLRHTRVAHGQFAADLPDYPAEWVWHGVILSTAADTARFMASERVAALRAPNVAVGRAGEPWRAPHYGLGLMIEPGEMYGHNGNGPGYSASCFHLERSAVTICVLHAGEGDDVAFAELLETAAPYR